MLIVKKMLSCTLHGINYEYCLTFKGHIHDISVCVSTVWERYKFCFTWHPYSYPSFFEMLTLLPLFLSSCNYPSSRLLFNVLLNLLITAKYAN